jgi:hypothetical protein
LLQVMALYLASVWEIKDIRRFPCTASDNPSQEVSGRAPHHHCVGMLGQATPPTLDADSDPIGQASAARTCWAAHRDIAMESSV